MSAPPLACTVRGCHGRLTRRDTTWACEHNHSFDIARSGYINLLQPQDRRSRDAGDTRAAVEARARLRAAGVGRVGDDRIVALASSCVADQAVVVELGSGSGETLAAVARLRRLVTVGIDLSIAAVEHAARRDPAVTWVVANADRRVPLLDGRVDLVISQHGRRNPLDCARVVRAGGHLLVSVPAADDLVELREAVLGEATMRPRAAMVISDHSELFELVSHEEVRERQRLDRAALLDLLQGTYRGARTRAATRLATLTELDVTVASDVCLFRRR